MTFGRRSDSAPGSYYDGVMDEVRVNLNTKLTQQLTAQVPEEVDHWCEVKTNCLAGKPFEELIKYATIHAVDLIVLGVRGRSLVDSMLLGSTTDRVVRRSRCPVLAVGPPSVRVSEDTTPTAAEEQA